MAKELKVYGWTGYRAEARKPGSAHSQTWEIMAAHSAAEVMRVANLSRADWKHSGSETGNTREIGIAMANPGRVIWRSFNDWEGTDMRAADGQPLD